MSIMNLGSGISIWLGPAIAGIFLPLTGVGGVMWIYAGLYAASAVIAWFLKSEQDEVRTKERRGGLPVRAEGI